MYDKIINAIDNVSTNVTITTLTNMRNTISTNITSTMPANSDDQKSKM